MPENKNSYNINIKELTSFAISKWRIFICFAVLFIAASLLYSSFIVTPLYDSSGKIYIMNKSSEAISSSDISVSTYLTRDYENLIGDSAVLREVSEELNNKYSVGELKKAVSVENPENTRFIEITVRTASANDSKVIVDTVCTVAQKKITELLGVDRVTIIRKGSVPSAPSVPNTQKNAIAAFIIACLAFLLTVFSAYYFNDKITEPEDVEKYLGISVLGNIPCNKSKRAK